MTSTTLKSKSEPKIKKERKPRTIKPKLEGQKVSTKKKAKPLEELEKTIEKIKNSNEVSEPTIVKSNKFKEFKDKIISFFKEVF
jgi:predicted RNA-binding protein with PUA domain